MKKLFTAAAIALVAFCGLAQAQEIKPSPFPVAYSLPSISVLSRGGDASGDIAGAARNAAAVSAIIAEGRCAYLPNTSAGANYNFGTNTVTLGTSACIKSDSGVVWTYTGTGAAVSVTAFGPKTGAAFVSGIVFNMASSSGTAVRLATSAAVVANAIVSDITCLDAVECVGDEATASYYSSSIYIKNINSYRTRGTQIYLRHSRGSVYLDNVHTTYNDVAQTTVDYSAIKLEDFVGLILRDVDISAGAATQSFSDVPAIAITGGTGYSSVWMSRVQADSCNTNGIAITGVRYLSTEAVSSSGCLGYQIKLDGVTQANLVATDVSGAHGVTGAQANMPGLQIIGASSVVNIIGVRSWLNTGDGVTVAGTSNAVSISGLNSYTNDGYQYSTGGTAANVKISSGYLGTGGSGAANMASSGAGNTICNVTNAPAPANRCSTWLTLGQSGAAASVTGTASETVLATITIPANSLGPNGAIRVRTSWSVTNSGNGKTLRVKLGGIGGTAFLATYNTTITSYSDVRVITNRNATNSQIGSAPINSQFAGSASALPTSAVDTTASTTLVITGELANTGETITLESYTVEVMYQ